MKVKISKYPKKSYRRNINVQIEHFDTYSLDHTLALIILPALIQLKQTKHGVPSEFADVGGEDYVEQQSFDFYVETHDEAFTKGVERWTEVLDKMIWAFQQLVEDDYDDLYHHGKMDMDWVKTDKTILNPVSGKVEATWQMVDKNPNEHWYDYEGHMLHEQRIQEGLELFGKYYRALWD